jgi:hypothetical protein
MPIKVQKELLLTAYFIRNWLLNRQRILGNNINNYNNYFNSIVNASILDEQYQPVYEPIYFEI